MLGHNTYNIRIRALDPKTGKMKGVERRRNCTLTEAVEQQRAWYEEIRSGGSPRGARTRLSDYANSWLATKLPTLKRSTRKKYLDCLVHHILPGLGDLYLDALTPADVRAWVKAESDRFAGNAVMNALRVLRTMTRDAVIDLRLTQWPCERVSGPRVAKPGRENLLSAAELRKLLDTMQVEEPYWYAMTMTLAYTGLRWSEATALKWSDIDEGQGVIWIQRGNWRGFEDTTKTDLDRSVPYTPELRQ